MVTVSELVVAIRGDGIDQTKEDLEGVEDSVEETTDSLDDQTSDLESFAVGFRGALSAIVVGLGVAATGLLSQVPVIGGAIAQIGTTVDLLVNKLNNDLRPAFSDFNDDLSETNKEVSESEGFIDALSTAVDGYVEAIRNLVAGGFQQKVEDALGIELTLDEAKFLTVGGADLDSLVQDVRSRILGEWDKLKSGTDRAFGNITESITERWTDFTDGLQDKLNNFTDGVVKGVKNLWPNTKQFFKKLKTNANEEFDDLVESAKKKGKELVSGFADGINDNLGFITSAASSLASKIDEYLPSSPAQTGPLSDLDKAGPALIDEFAGGIRQRSGEVADSTGTAMRSSEDGSSRLPRPRNTTTKLFIDGREAGRGTQSERFDESARRGQTF